MSKSFTEKLRGAGGLAVVHATVACCLVISSIAGCGSGDELVPVEGVVMLDGKPLPAATVVLSPTTAVGPGPFMGTTDTEGKFVLGPAGHDNRQGAQPGEYRLSISTLQAEFSEGGGDSAKPRILAPELVPDEYRLGNMRFEVPAAGTTEAYFDITSQ